MSRVVAVSGLGDESVTLTQSPRPFLLWGIVIGTTVGIFVGTLMLKPKRRR